MIQTAKVNWEVYKKKQESEIEQAQRKKREIEEMEQKIKQEEEERKRKEKEEKEKFRLKQMEEQKLAETKELAFSELDKANLSLERKKYDKALESYNIALEKFKILGGWDKEVNMIMEKIEHVNKLIRTPLQAKESLSSKETAMSNEAYKELDEADKLVRLKKEEEALEHMRKARSLFLELKWDKAINMIEKRIEDTNAIIEEKRMRLEKLKARQSQMTEEDAFKLLEEVDRDKKYKKYEDAIPKAKKAQDIFMSLDGHEKHQT